MKHGDGSDNDDRSEFDLKSRHTRTDIPCCLLFIGTIVAFSFLYRCALQEGDIGKLSHGISNQGQICGVDPAVKDQPYLYWCPLQLAQGKLSLNMKKPICVAHCPGAPNSGSAYEYNIPDCDLVSGPLGMTSYKSLVLLGRYCIPNPKDYKDAAKQVTQGQFKNWKTRVLGAMSSIPAAWPIIAGTFLASVVMGYVYLVLLRHCAETLVVMTIVASVVVSCCLGVYLLTHAGTLLDDVPDNVKPEDVEQNEVLLTRIAAAVCFAFAFLLVCLGCCYRHAIDTAASCVEVACDAMFEMPSLLFTPIFKAAIKGLLCLVLLYGFLNLYSTGDVSQPTVGHNGVYRTLEFTQKQNYEIVAYLFCSLWILAFVNALFQFMIAYAIAEYYYAPYDPHDGQKEVGCCAIWDGFVVGLCYHAGSLAFGSLLIAVLSLIQKAIEYAEKENKDTVNSKVVTCILCCCAMCIRGCKSFIELVNKNAYIDIAVTSHSYCAAATEAVAMMARLGGSMAILNGATFVFSICGTLAITLASGGFAFFCASNGFLVDQESDPVQEPLAVLVVSMLIGFVVSLSFMNVFDMTSDTLLYCYGIDLENGKPGHTAPQGLKDLYQSCSPADQH